LWSWQAHGTPGDRKTGSRAGFSVVSCGSPADCYRPADFLPEPDRALVFLVALLRPDDFFAVDFFAVDFFAVDFFAPDFFAVDFFAVDFLPVDFFAAPLRPPLLVALLRAPPFFAVLFRPPFFAAAIVISP